MDGFVFLSLTPLVVLRVKGNLFEQLRIFVNPIDLFLDFQLIF
jgi:hypothetical protein